DFSRSSRSDGQRARRAHDGHGFGDQQCFEDDGHPYAADEPSPPGVDHTGTDGNRRHGGSGEIARSAPPLFPPPPRGRMKKGASTNRHFGGLEAMSNMGKITQVLGAVIDVEFSDGNLPPIY